MAVPPLTHISRFPYHEIHKGLVITQVLSQYETGMQPEGASGPSPPVFCHQDVTKSFSVVCAGQTTICFSSLEHIFFFLMPGTYIQREFKDF